jgi:hypothetical protein
MSTKKLIIAFSVLVVVAIGIFSFIPVRESQSAPSDTVSRDGTTVSHDIAEEQDVQSVVEAFGQRLQSVSLLSPPATLKQSMETNYGPYVDPALLSDWENDPGSAPGRTVSSPWPERIAVLSIEMQKEGSYIVHGMVIEVTSQQTEQGGIAGMYPVTFVVQKSNGVWRINHFTKDEYQNLSSATVLRGTITCLPHKGSGAQTMECAIGLEDAAHKYYALDTSLLKENKIMMAPTGSTVALEGLLTYANTLNSDTWQRYDIVGILRVLRIIDAQ